MKFNLEEIPNRLVEGEGVCVGNVYPAKGGSGTTRFWLIVSITGNTCHSLGLNPNGEVVSSTSYSIRTFEQRTLVGVCPCIAEISFDIEWRDL